MQLTNIPHKRRKSVQNLLQYAGLLLWEWRKSAWGKRIDPFFAELTELWHLSLTTLEWSKKSIHGPTRSCRTAQFHQRSRVLLQRLEWLRDEEVLFKKRKQEPRRAKAIVRPPCQVAGNEKFEECGEVGRVWEDMRGREVRILHRRNDFTFLSACAGVV